MIPFRASADRSGWQEYRSPHVAVELGGAFLQRFPQHPVDLVGFHLELMGFINARGRLDVGIKLTPNDAPLTRRNRVNSVQYTTSLKSTVAHLMVQTAKVRCSRVVCVALRRCGSTLSLIYLALVALALLVRLCPVTWCLTPCVVQACCPSRWPSRTVPASSRWAATLQPMTSCWEGGMSARCC